MKINIMTCQQQRVTMAMVFFFLNTRVRNRREENARSEGVPLSLDAALKVEKGSGEASHEKR